MDSRHDHLLQSKAKNDMNTDQRTIAVRKPVLIKFRDWLNKEGFFYQKKPSPTAFFREMADDKWKRRNSPKPKNSYLTTGQVSCLGVTVDAYNKLGKHLHAYHSWNHLLADIAADNWRRVA